MTRVLPSTLRTYLAAVRNCKLLDTAHFGTEGEDLEDPPTGSGNALDAVARALTTVIGSAAPVIGMQPGCSRAAA